MPDVYFQNTTNVVWKDTAYVIWGEGVLAASLGINFQEDNDYNNCEAVTKHDTNLLSNSGIIYIGTGGSLKVDIIGTGTVTFANVPNGATLNARCKRVWSTGTTATDIVALF